MPAGPRAPRADTARAASDASPRGPSARRYAAPGRRASARRPVARRAVTGAGLLLGVAALVLGVGYLLQLVDDAPVDLAAAARALAAEPGALLVALSAYDVAFVVRSLAWRRVLPGLSLGQAWAALHVSLLGNHVLPLRLGEPLRVTSVLRRTALPTAPVVASAVALRGADVLAVLGLAALGAPALLAAVNASASPAGLALAVAVLAVVAVTAGGVLWLVRLHRRRAAVRLPGPGVVAAVLIAWLLESVVVAQVSGALGAALSPGEAVAVTAVTVAAQAVAVTPGGFGTYEAAATAALVATGVPAGLAVAVALATHLLKTGYAVLLGLLALAVPAPGYLGRLRLPRRPPPRAPRAAVDRDAPVVALVPVHDEAVTIAEVVRRLPRTVAGRPVVPLVVDDGSTDGSGALAAAAGARVVRLPANRGLGAAVREGLTAASALRPAAVVYLDADLEYEPAALADLAAPVLAGDADYVVGSRFAGTIHRMHPQRRLGNRLLSAWLRWTARRPDLTDGQSGYRAFSPEAAAAAEVVHDYNYAQVLTLDLLGKGFRYAEVPITYAFRAHGTSFVRPLRYLRRVVPAVHRELNSPT